MTCLKAGSLLHPVARLVPPVALEGRDEGLEPVGPKPVPARLVDDRVARHHEDVLVAHRDFSRIALAAARRERRGLLVGAIGPVELGLPGVQHAAQVAQPRAQLGRVRDRDRGAHRRVAACDAGRVAPAAGGQSRGDRPLGTCGRARLGVAGSDGDGLDQRRGDDERQMADRGHGTIVGARIHLDDHRPGRPRRARSRVRCRSGRRGHPGRRPTGDRRTGPRRMPRSRRSPGRPSGGHRRTTGRSHRPARRSPPSCWRRRSRSHRGRMILRQRPASRSISGRTRGRRTGQDDQVRVTQDATRPLPRRHR